MATNSTIMSQKKITSPPPSLTELLRTALAEADSMRAVARACGLNRAALLRFARGDQSMRLEAADALAAHFGITHVKGDE